jgi:hypothetical protein
MRAMKVFFTVHSLESRCFHVPRGDQEDVLDQLSRRMGPSGPKSFQVLGRAALLMESASQNQFDCFSPRYLAL